MAEQLVNDPGTTLSADITSGATSFTPSSTTGYPSTGNFRIRIDSELMMVTASSSGVWTVTRGIEGTTAASHGTGAAINAVLTSGGLAQYVSDQTVPGIYSGSAPPGIPSPTVVQSNITSTTTASAPTSLAFAGSVTAGNLIIVCVSTRTNTGEGYNPGTCNSVTDNHGTTYTQAVSNNILSSGQIWYGVASVSGSYTITCGYTGSISYPQIALLEVSGLNTPKQGTAVNTGQNKTISLTTTTTYAFVVAWCVGYRTTSTFTFSTGLSRDAQQSGTNACSAVAHGTFASTGSQSLTVTTGDDWPCFVAVGFPSTIPTQPGIDGSFYIDLTKKNLYGPKSGGSYGSAIAGFGSVNP